MSILKRFAVALFAIVELASQTQAAEPEKSGADAMRELRLRALSAPAKEFGITPTKDVPRTYAVLIDFPIGQETATLVSISDGSTSLYTTSTFGIIGGGAHESVKSASARLISSSDKFYDEAKPTKTYPYPANGKVRFYFVSFRDVRVIEADLSLIESNKSKYASLFWLGQEVFTHLRIATGIK